MLKRRLEEMTEPDLREYMIACGRAIEATASVRGIEAPLFCLLLFNDPKASQYICNADRSGVIEAMRETANHLEANQDIPR